MQVLWDGYFHALMYVIAAVGLWGLWRAHQHTEGAWGRPLFGALLVGFGFWHAVDSVLSHWVLGIHRIKLDSANPLIWDLIWFVAFALIPIAIGWPMVRGGGAGPRLRGSTLAMLLLTAGTVGAGAWSLRPPPDQPFTTVVFRPDYGPAEVFSALAAVDARLVWSDQSMGVIVVSVPPERRWNFYRHGAMLVSGSGAPAGCFSWSTV